MSSGVYIHIPFCIKKCNYCDFNSYDCKNNLMEPYVNTLLDEIKAGLPEDYDTVFIGGGTPTALPLPLLLKIIKSISKEVIEFTVEVNPATLDYEGFCMLKKCGVNRISLGLQSSNEDELKTLGRIHSFSDFEISFRNARKAGFDNINVDIMFSLPNQSISRFQSTLKAVASLSPEHVSCYSLIIEEGTPFYEMNFTLPSEEEDREMYLFCVDYLKQQNYHQYEISNFAKADFECRHNIKYWERTDYYGFGAGAHSLIDNIRYENNRSVEDYINGNTVSKTNLTHTDIKNEFIFLGLRKTNGISLDEYKIMFGKDFLHEHSDIIKKYSNFCSTADGRFFLTLEGISVSNSIICDFLE